MTNVKQQILNNLCYTELVYKRINKKLKSNLTKKEIELKLLELITQTDSHNINQIGKNYYIYNTTENIRITVNSNTYRVITVDKILK